MTGKRVKLLAVLAILIPTAAVLAMCQDNDKIGYDDTPFLPGSEYRVHDGTRPQPPIVDPGAPSTQERPGTPPSDAIVLFDGTDLSAWRSGRGGSAGWKVEDGAMVIEPGSGSISTVGQFGDCQLHIEFATPQDVRGRGQGRGNSGVMFFERYEIQILDSDENKTYPDGQAAAIYGQFPPLVNASRPPGQWQSFDILFRAPVFDEEGELVKPAVVTMFHNGVLVHDHVELIGAVAFRAVGEYSPHGPKGSILLQDHGNPVRFRNIWVRELESEN